MSLLSTILGVDIKWSHGRVTRFKVTDPDKLEGLVDWLARKAHLTEAQIALLTAALSTD